MSRVAKNPVSLPQGVSATIAAGLVTIKGAKGSLSLPLGNGVTVTEQDKALQVAFDTADGARMRAGSARSHLANMVNGVTKGYERKLELVGVGFRAAVAGKTLNLTLGFSHPVAFPIPEGILAQLHRLQQPTEATTAYRKHDGRAASSRQPLT